MTKIDSSNIEIEKLDKEKSERAVFADSDNKGKKRKMFSGVVIGEQVNFQKTLTKTINEGVDDIVNQAKRYKDNPLNSRTGYVAEADHWVDSLVPVWVGFWDASA
jgi:hypothetical protein